MIRFVLSLIALFSISASGAEIRFPYQPRWNSDGYLLHFLRMVPLDQFAVSEKGDEIRITGRLYVELGDLPDSVRDAIDTALREAVAGRRMVSGARIDSRNAMIEFSTTPPASFNEIPELNLALFQSQSASTAPKAEEPTRPLSEAEQRRIECEAVFMDHLFKF